MKVFKSEAEFTTWVMKEARARGWSAWHLEPMRVVHKRGGAIAVPSPDAKGFPDVVLAHPEHGLLFAELKLDGGSPKPAQVATLLVLRAAGARACLWHPSNQNEIADLLDGRPSTARLFQEVV